MARAYRAACTPDLFLFDRDLRRALDGLLAGQPIDPVQRSSMGCNIKWRPGNAPSSFSGG